MRPINIIGLCCFFLPLAIKYRSKRALIIFLNGLLYHSNERYQYLRYYDVICNFFIVLYTIKNNADTKSEIIKTLSLSVVLK